MVEQASNKTKNTSYSARQGVSQGQKPYTQTTFFSLRKFPFPRSTVSRTVWLRSAVSPRYARSDKRSALSDNLSNFPTISESETFSRKKKLVFVSVLPMGYTLFSSRNNYSVATVFHFTVENPENCAGHNTVNLMTGPSKNGQHSSPLSLLLLRLDYISRLIKSRTEY